jgi:hypothetical protein
LLQKKEYIKNLREKYIFIKKKVSLQLMQRLKSIFLLFIFGLLISFSSLFDFCITGHKHHHEPGKPTPCELRKLYKGDGMAIWPPMCHKVSVNTDDYQLTNEVKIEPSIQTIVVAAVLLDLISLDYSEEPFLLPPDPKCRSATLISTNRLRGPPIF